MTVVNKLLMRWGQSNSLHMPELHDHTCRTADAWKESFQAIWRRGRLDMIGSQPLEGSPDDKKKGKQPGECTSAFEWNTHGVWKGRFPSALQSLGIWSPLAGARDCGLQPCLAWSLDLDRDSQSLHYNFPASETTLQDGSAETCHGWLPWFVRKEIRRAVRGKLVCSLIFF